MSQTQERPYVMDTGWERGIHGDLDGEALYRWAELLESQIATLAEELEAERLWIKEGKKLLDVQNASPKLLKACQDVFARLERFEMDYDSRQILKTAIAEAEKK